MNLLCPLKTRLYILEDRDKKMSKTKENGMNETRVSRNFHEDARFTLVELLVVIAILSILVSLVMQSLRTGMEAARIIACATNLKQIGNATSMYVNDDNERRYPATVRQSSGYSWDDMLSQYDGRELTDAQMLSGPHGSTWGNDPRVLPGGQNHGQMYRCPSDSRDWSVNLDFVKRTYSPSGAIKYVSYPNDGEIAAARGIVGIWWGDWAGDAPGDWRFFSQSEKLLSRPFATIAFTEEHTYDVGWGWDAGIRARMGNTWVHGMTLRAEMFTNVINHNAHGKGGFDYNYLMADGHVETLLFIDSLVKDDGTLAISSDVRNTKWDASSVRR